MWRPLPFVLCFLVATAAFVPALDASAPMSCRPGVVFENEDVRVWFHGAKGFVKVFDANGSDEDGDHFAYDTGELVEKDGSGAVVAQMNLQRAFPQTSGCTIEETDEWVNMTLTVTDDVRAGNGPAIGDATVTFAYHFNKTSQGAKFDLHVDQWPWQSSGGLLAYAFNVHAAGGSLEAAENGVGIRGTDGTSKGYVEWAPNATATYDDGHEETSLVDGDTTVNGQTARVELSFTNVTAGYTNLAYDPWAGVGEYVIVGGVLIGLAPTTPVLRLVRNLLG